MIDNYVRKATVCNVVDGDTLDAIVDLGYGITTTHRFRLLGINTPERRQEGYQEAKDYLKERVVNKEVSIESVKSDSFGRYLGTIYLDGENINQTMLELGYAVIYEK